VYSREQLAQSEFKGFLDRVLDGSVSPLVAHFIESGDLSTEELRELKGLIEQKTRERESRRRGRQDR
jgi:BlaI family penicillinase repressor